MRLTRWLLALALWLPCGVAAAATLDIAIVGDDYLDQTAFLRDAEEVASYIFSMPPYPNYASRVRFHPVWNQRDLYCQYDSPTGRLLTCSQVIAYDVAHQAGVPFDFLIVLVNSTRYGGSGGIITVAYNGSQIVQVAAHEFAHTFGGLLDEYNLYASGGQVAQRTQANCFQGTPPATDPAWATATYDQGCKYGNWKRSSPCSLMKSLSCPYFNHVSTVILTNKLAFWTGSPSVMLSASPLQGVVPLTVTFSVTASAPSGGALSYQWTLS